MTAVEALAEAVAGKHSDLDVPFHHLEELEDRVFEQLDELGEGRE